MKYFSEKLKKLYDTEEALKKAEELVLKAEAEKLAKEKLLKETRATRAKNVEAAIKKADEARELADKLLSDFVKDYGSFHYSYTTEKPKATDSVTNDFLKQVFSFLGEI